MAHGQQVLQRLRRAPRQRLAMEASIFGYRLCGLVCTPRPTKQLLEWCAAALRSATDIDSSFSVDKKKPALLLLPTCFSMHVRLS